LLETIFKANPCCFGFKQWTSTCHSMGWWKYSSKKAGI
jgi:hypothetical protein